MPRNRHDPAPFTEERRPRRGENLLWNDPPDYEDDWRTIGRATDDEDDFYDDEEDGQRLHNTGRDWEENNAEMRADYRYRNNPGNFRDRDSEGRFGDGQRYATGRPGRGHSYPQRDQEGRFEETGGGYGRQQDHGRGGDYRPRDEDGRFTAGGSYRRGSSGYGGDPHGGYRQRDDEGRFRGSGNQSGSRSYYNDNSGYQHRDRDGRFTESGSNREGYGRDYDPDHDRMGRFTEGNQAAAGTQGGRGWRSHSGEMGRGNDGYRHRDNEGRSMEEDRDRNYSQGGRYANQGQPAGRERTRSRGGR